MRRLLVAAIAFAAAALSGCSVTRVAYDNADTLLRWQANSYFDLHGEQSDEFDARLAAFLAWHRARALPKYARIAGEAADRVQRGLKREDLEWSYDAVQSQVREALGTAAMESAALLDGLRPEQISHLEQRLADENRKFAREQVQGTMEERHKRRVKRNVDRLEEWLGPLTDAQKERVRRYSEQAPFSAELRDRDRRRRQGEFLAMLRAREARQRLPGWARDWDAGREPAYAEASRATREAYFELLLDLDRGLAPEQRERAAGRLRRFGQLFDSLSRAQQ